MFFFLKRKNHRRSAEHGLAARPEVVQEQALPCSLPPNRLFDPQKLVAQQPK